MMLAGWSLFSGVSIVVWLALYAVGLFWPDVLGPVPLLALPLFAGAALVLSCMGQPTPFRILPYFLASVFLFFCLNIVLWPLTSQTPYEFFSLVSLVIERGRMNEAASLLGLSLSLTLAVYGATGPALRAPAAPAHQHRRQLVQLGVALMAVSAPVVFYRLFNEFKHILEAGYLALYAEGLSGTDAAAAWMLPFNYMFYAGFGLLCAFARDRATLLVGMGLFLLAALFDGIKGARGAVLVPILFCWWFYTSQFRVRIRLHRVAVALALMAAVFLGITVSRDEETIDSAVGQFVVDAVSSQARSLQLTAVYLNEQEKVAEYGDGMVWSNLMLPALVVLHPELREAPQSIEQVMYSNNLKHIFTYTLNPDYYFAGGGTGGVYLIELIEAGPFQFLVLSCLLGWFLASMPSLMRRPWIRFVSLQLFSTVFYMPRAELFPNLLLLGKSCLIFLALVAAVLLLAGLRRDPAPLPAA